MRWSVMELEPYISKVVREFYAGLPPETPSDPSQVFVVRIRGAKVRISPGIINETLRREPLSEAERKEEAEADLVPISEVSKYLSQGHQSVWSELTSRDFPPRIAALMVIASYNWVLSTNKHHISEERARLVYKLAHGVKVDIGRMIFQQMLDLSKVIRGDQRWLMFPCLISKVIKRQLILQLEKGEMWIFPTKYKKDPRSGETFLKKEAAAAATKVRTKGKEKKEARKKTASASTSHQPRTNLRSTATAQPEIPTEGVNSVSLGVIRVPEAPADAKGIRTALEDVASVLEQLGIVTAMLRAAVTRGED
ncbi:uncharacterized protein LOC112089861 [Eutrema salsugineum]|uniref:uncharacterized protein LOC112089861 n=1 Tax=Eutrema salsugineum TaxID=72664 RepID=UPI000CED1F5A|nr:uncharacterized protein LOC112089861 [Eutrema salsugineum]